MIKKFFTILSFCILFNSVTQAQTGPLPCAPGQVLCSCWCNGEPDTNPPATFCLTNPPPHPIHQYKACVAVMDDALCWSSLSYCNFTPNPIPSL